MNRRVIFVLCLEVKVLGLLPISRELRYCGSGGIIIVVQYGALWQENASNCRKYDVVSIFTI